MRILAIEGQGNFGFVKSQLLDPLAKTHQFEVETQEWHRLIHYSPRFDIVIGHSLGGPTAIRVARETKARYLITLDPRHQSNWSMLDIIFPWQRKFVAPKDVKTFNFIHLPPMLFPGYEVKGATNHKVYATHLGIPGHQAVRECLEKILLGEY